MAYNGFPATYPQMYYTPQQPYQMQNPYMQATQAQQAQPQPQAMTPPTIHADIIQVEGEAEADRYPMAAGSPPQMFIQRDEKAIYIKTMMANNSHELKVYPLRPPKPPAPAVDMGLYVTRDELEKRLKALSGAVAASKRETVKEGE